jgi:nitroreductase
VEIVLAASVPPAPEFAETLPIEASPEVVAFLAKRRSASAMSLAAPGPDDAQLADLLRIAARVPDHGKLAPWRFVILKGAAKDAFAEQITALGRQPGQSGQGQRRPAQADPPAGRVAVISRFIPGEIPEWEQRQSASAVCTRCCWPPPAWAGAPTGSPTGTATTRAPTRS